MISKVLLKFNECLLKPFKKYQEMLSKVNNTTAYEIKDLNFVNGCYKLLIQINGTGKIVPFWPREIINDENLLTKFSSKDTQLIHYLNFEELNKPKYKIVGHKFSEKNITIIRLKDRESGEIKDFAPSELTTLNNVLQRMPIKSVIFMEFNNV